jgi:SAM-dependent methyltransferase
MRVLDIGCGWGGAARFLAERYGVEVVGVTISHEQARFAAEHCRGLPVSIELRDYRSLEGIYDRVYSLGMFEHVGWRNYRTFLRAVSDRLVRDGLFLLHTIGRAGHGARRRRLGRALHLPELSPSVGRADRGGQRGAVPGRRLAQLRRGLRSDPDRLARKLRARVAAAGGALWRAVPPDVALLPVDRGGRVPRAPQPGLADRAVAARRSRRLSLGALALRRPASSRERAWEDWLRARGRARD